MMADVSERTPFRGWPCALAWGAALALPLAAAHAADTTAPSNGQPLHPFAMCSNGNMLTNPEYPVKMLDAGARMCRVDITFGTVRPKPGDDADTWNWSGLEKIRGLRKQHPDLQFLVLLGYGPAWAEDAKFKPAKPYEGQPPFS